MNKNKSICIGILFVSNLFCTQINAQTSNNCYAVLINGGYDRPDNYEHFYNDLKEVYITLIDYYNYNENNIYVLNSDGSNIYADMNSSSGYISSDPDLDGDGDDDINYSATENNLKAVFNTLSPILDPDDFLFIFITGATNFSYRFDIVLWHERMSLSDFADEVDDINAGEICILNSASFGGTMVDYLDDWNRVILSATNWIEILHVTPNVFGNGLFMSNWLAAVRGETISGNTPADADFDNNGYVSMDEAFTYSDNKTISDEEPQYKSKKYTLGENLTLLGKEICVSTDIIHDIDYYYETKKLIDCNFDLENVNIVVADISFEANEDIYIQSDILIGDDSNVTFEAGENVVIHSNFKVNSGSTFRIID